MTRLAFECLDIFPERHAFAPTLVFRLRVAETTGERIHAIALRCQIRIEPQRRTYAPEEADRLLDLFGDTARWGDTLKPMQFTTLSTMVPGFQGSTVVDLAVPCTYDFEVATAKYFHALDAGEIPLLLLFSGTIFARGQSGFEVAPVPWEAEAAYRLPVRVWRELMDLYFPGSAWIRVRRETLDALQRFKAEHALTGWDQALEALLARGREPAP